MFRQLFSFGLSSGASYRLSASRWCAILMLIGMPLGGVSAQENSSQESAGKPYQLSIGAGAYGVHNPYNGKTEWGALPYFSFNTEWISIDPSGVALQLFDHEGFRVEALLAPRWLLAEPKSNTKYSHLSRSSGIDTGARVALGFGRYEASVEYKRDISGHSKGYELTPGIGAAFELTPRFMLRVKSGLYWRDKKLSDYLYGVLPGEARAGSPAYSPGNTLSPFVGVMTRYYLTQRTSIMVALEGERFPQKVKKSPLMNKRYSVSAFSAVVYDF